MQLSLNQKQFHQALKTVAKTLIKRPHLPVLAGILLKTNNDSLELSTTDLIAGIKTSLPATIKKPGEVIVSGQILIDSVGFFEQEQTQISLLEKTLVLKNGHDKINLPIFTDAYPDFNSPPPQSSSFNFPLTFWEDIIKKIIFAVSLDQSKPALTGVFFQPNSLGTKVVCTDGYRLAVWQTQHQIPNLKKDGLIISAKSINDVVAIAQIFSLEEIGFFYDEANEQVFFLSNNFSYFSKVINSNYPPFEKIIPLDFATEVSFDRQEFSKNLAKASVFTRNDSHTITLKFAKEKICFTASSTTQGNFTSEQDANVSGEENLEISFNIRYLQDFFSTRSCDTLWLGCNNATTPALFRDPDDTKIQYVVMPFRPKK